jgi:hypothetical protein
VLLVVLVLLVEGAGVAVGVLVAEGAFVGVGVVVVEGVLVGAGVTVVAAVVLLFLIAARILFKPFIFLMFFMLMLV